MCMVLPAIAPACSYPPLTVPPARGGTSSHPTRGCCSVRGRRSTLSPQGAGAGQPCNPTRREQRECPRASTQPASRSSGERESRKANGSSRLRISGFWFPFLLPAVSMETGVGPGKIRLGFAVEALRQHLPPPHPTGACVGYPPLPRPAAMLMFGAQPHRHPPAPSGTLWLCACWEPGTR